MLKAIGWVASAMRLFDDEPDNPQYASLLGMRPLRVWTLIRGIHELLPRYVQDSSVTWRSHEKHAPMDDLRRKRLHR